MKTIEYRSLLVALVATLAFSIETPAQVLPRQNTRRLTQVTILPQKPVAGLIQPSPMNQGTGRWRTNRPMISSGFEMPTRPLFLGGYAGRNYGRGIRQAYVPVAPGSVEGELRTIELKPLR